MTVNKLIYPIILHPESEGGYSVEIPDINGGSWTQGETVDEAIMMAEDLIGTVLQSETEYPEAAPISSLVKSNEDIVALAQVNIDEFRKLHSTTVRKNVSVPEYLVVLGNKKGINFSSTLTRALKEELGV